MKTVSRLCAIVFISVSILSCTKTELISGTNQTPLNTEPSIFSTISRNIVQPARMELGTPNAVLRQGDVVTIFVPYSASNEAFVSTTISMLDANTDEVLNTYELLRSTDPSATDLALPEHLYDNPDYFFVTFTVEEAFVGKSISLKTKLEGQVASSEDVLTNAFNVIP